MHYPATSAPRQSCQRKQCEANSGLAALASAGSGGVLGFGAGFDAVEHAAFHDKADWLDNAP